MQYRSCAIPFGFYTTVNSKWLDLWFYLWFHCCKITVKHRSGHFTSIAWEGGRGEVGAKEVMVILLAKGEGKSKPAPQLVYVSRISCQRMPQNMRLLIDKLLE